MVKLVDMDPNVRLGQQLEERAGGAVILINKLDVAPTEVDQFLEAFAADAAYFKRQRGFISAFSNSEFRAALSP